MGMTAIRMAVIPFGKGESPIWKGILAGVFPWERRRPAGISG